MCKKRHSAIKAKIISGLFALLAFNYAIIVEAATVSNRTMSTVSADFSVDSAATDFYIFGENVKKSGSEALFSDISGAYNVITDSTIKVSWAGGDPVATSTGSSKYDSCALGSSFSPRATSCSFTVKVPTANAKLDLWLVPTGNTGTLQYTLTVGNDVYSYDSGSSNISRNYQRFSYDISNATANANTTANDIVTVTIDNTSGSNGLYNIGFQAAQLFAVKSNQTIAFNELSTKIFGDVDFDLTATASSGLTISYIATGNCAVSNSTVKITGAGNCTIKADQMGNDEFNAAPSVSQSFTIEKTNQTVTFTPALTGTAGQSTALSATGGLSNNPIVFASTTPTICTLSGNTVSFVSAGICMITANQAGNDKYNPAKEISANIIVTVAQIINKNQTLTLISSVEGKVGETGVLKAISSAELTEISFATTSNNVCEISGNNITYKTEGTCTVTMTQVGNEQFNAATQNVEIFVISKGVFSLRISDKDKLPILQAIEGETLNIDLTFKAPESDVSKKAKFYVTATADNLVLMLTPEGFVPATKPLQSIKATDISLLRGMTVLPVYSGVLPAGKYALYAKYETTEGNQQEASSGFTIKKKQDISFENLPQNPKVEDKINLTVTGGGSNNPIALTSNTIKICTIQDKVVTFIAEGKCTISATQQGNDLFADTLVAKTITIISKGVFSLNITDNNGKPITQALDSDVLTISLTFKAPTDDVNKGANAYLNAKWANTYFKLTAEGFEAVTDKVALMLTPQGFVTATDPQQPVNAANISLPKDSLTVPLYTGMLSAGEYAVSAWYETTDGNKQEATSIFKVVSKVYAQAHAEARARGQSLAYADAYADAYAKAKASNNYSEVELATLANAYALTINALFINLSK